MRPVFQGDSNFLPVKATATVSNPTELKALLVREKDSIRYGEVLGVVAQLAEAQEQSHSHTRLLQRLRHPKRQEIYEAWILRRFDNQAAAHAILDELTKHGLLRKHQVVRGYTLTPAGRRALRTQG